MSLTVYNNDGLELVINTATGEAFATVNSYARMSGKDKSVISRRVKGVAPGSFKTAEILTAGGVQGVALIPAKTVFAWMVKDNPELAIAMGEAGATVFLHKLAGYEVKSEAIAPEPQQAELVRGEMDILAHGLAIAGFRPELIAGVTLNHAASRMPQLTKSVSDVQKLLAATTQSQLLLTPTTIGEKLGISAMAVNQLLLGMGLQEKNPRKGKGEPRYLATSKGKEYADNTLATGRAGDNSTYQHLKWHENIVEVLRKATEQA
jgi:hypothetical protein